MLLVKKNMQFSLVYPMIVDANLLTNGNIDICFIEKYGMQYSE